MRLLHVSDLHFGAPSIPAQVGALEGIIATERFDAIVISGDISQRTRTREFERGRQFITLAERYAPVMIVPGNHDVAWWTNPMGLGSRDAMYERYRRLIRADLEPVLQLPGLTLVGLNSAHGVQLHTLTLRPRDLSVVGSVTEQQWKRAREAFGAAPQGDLRVLVIHHNLLRGRLSNRWGLSSRARGIAAAMSTGADVVLCGHDHEEHVARVQAGDRALVVASASTLTDRVRGGGPSSLNVIEADAATVTVTVLEWSGNPGTFARARWEKFVR